jgi:hypothetical protein
VASSLTLVPPTSITNTLGVFPVCTTFMGTAPIVPKG